MRRIVYSSSSWIVLAIGLIVLLSVGYALFLLIPPSEPLKGLIIFVTEFLIAAYTLGIMNALSFVPPKEEPKKTYHIPANMRKGTPYGKQVNPGLYQRSRKRKK